MKDGSADITCDFLSFEYIQEWDFWIKELLILWRIVFQNGYSNLHSYQHYQRWIFDCLFCHLAKKYVNSPIIFVDLDIPTFKSISFALYI